MANGESLGEQYIRIAWDNWGLFDPQEKMEFRYRVFSEGTANAISGLFEEYPEIAGIETDNASPSNIIVDATTIPNLVPVIAGFYYSHQYGSNPNRWVMNAERIPIFLNGYLRVEMGYQKASNGQIPTIRESEALAEPDRFHPDDPVHLMAVTAYTYQDQIVNQARSLSREAINLARDIAREAEPAYQMPIMADALEESGASTEVTQLFREINLVAFRMLLDNLPNIKSVTSYTKKGITHYKVKASPFLRKS